MADISGLTVKVTLRGLWLFKLACWVGIRTRLLPNRWRIAMVNAACRRLGVQVGNGPIKRMNMPLPLGKGIGRPPTPPPDTDTGRDMCI